MIVAPAGPPSRWVARGGRYAACLANGLPSFVHEDAHGLWVYDALICQWTGPDESPRFFPRWYDTACVVEPDGGVVPLWHGVDAEWAYRPCVYRLRADARMERMGSQQELSWRKGLADMMAYVHADVPFELPAACRRADELLLEHLSSQQRLELAKTHSFRVRGASGVMYRVVLMKGFDELDEVTALPVTTFCFHPDYWLPESDVALATKLMLEDAELEQEIRANANAVPHPQGPAATPADRAAARLERDLIA